jgi:hypothetical protein
VKAKKKTPVKAKKKTPVKKAVPKEKAKKKTRWRRLYPRGRKQTRMFHLRLLYLRHLHLQ